MTTQPDIKKIVDEVMANGCLLAKATTHEEFVEGINSKKMIYEIRLQNKSKILQGRSKLFFNIYVLMYTLFPIIFIPCFAYHYNNWLILLGLPITYLGVFLGGRKSSFPFYITLGLLGWWTAAGFHFHSFPVFFIVCLWWGYIWFQIADEGEKQFTKEALLNNADLYNRLAENDLLFIMKEPALSE